MSGWTIRPRGVARLRQGEKQTHPAALQAARYVRLHAWQFHGAGVADAVQKLAGLKEFGEVSNAMRDAMARMGTMLALPTAVLASYDHTPRPFVVGWWYEDQHYLCNAHRRPGAVPVKAVDVTSSTACRDCGARLLGLAPAGWKSPSGLLLCPEHSHANGTPLTAAELPEGATCAVCSEGLTPDTEPSRPSLTAKCRCTHPYSTHNVHGLCIALPGVLGCGCLGWSEVRT